MHPLAQPLEDVARDEVQVGGDELVLRPANCPHHALIYSSVQRSYRDLPVRFNELAAMFRAERSGVLSGLSRVRQINLDDLGVAAGATLSSIVIGLDTLGNGGSTVPTLTVTATINSQSVTTAVPEPGSLALLLLAGAALGVARRLRRR